MSAVASTVSLCELADLNPKMDANLDADDVVSFLPMSGVDADKVDAIDVETRRYADVKKGYTPFQRDDVLVAKITPCFENGKIARASLRLPYGFGSTEFHVIRAKQGKLDARFLTHYLRQKKIRFAGERRMTGSAGQRRVPENFLAELSVPNLSIKEQQRIADILDRTEALRAKRRAALAQLDSLTQAIFIEMFGDPATNSNGWPYRKLLDLGRVVTGSTPSSAKLGMFDGPIPFITPGDLESDEPVKRSLTAAGAEESGTIGAGATLVCCIGATIGKIGIAIERSAFNQQLNAVEWGNEVDSIYGYIAMKFFKPTIKAWGASTTLPILKKSSFEKIEIPVPPLVLQRKFAQRFHAIEELRARQKTSLSVLEQLFASLQSRAFSGEL